MFTQQILFRGTNVIEQVHLIMTACGYPGDDYVAALPSQADIDFCMQGQYRALHRRPAAEMLRRPAAGPDPPLPLPSMPSMQACQLLDMLLRYRVLLWVAVMSRY